MKPPSDVVLNPFQALLVDYEGWVSTVYPDSGGAPTIGVGHLLTRDERRSGKIVINGVPVRYEAGLTSPQILALLEQDVAPAMQTVDRYCAVGLGKNQRHALISFTFNVGNTAFRNSTLLRKLNAGEYEAVPAQLRRWVHDGGKRVQGLVNRREKEVALWLTPDA